MIKKKIHSDKTIIKAQKNKIKTIEFYYLILSKLTKTLKKNSEIVVINLAINNNSYLFLYNHKGFIDVNKYEFEL